jgi:hypothetical protein
MLLARAHYRRVPTVARAVASSGDAHFIVGEAVEDATATTHRARAPEYAEWAGNGSDAGVAAHLKSAVLRVLRALCGDIRLRRRRIR